jgi:hypothetical protein
LKFIGEMNSYFGETSPDMGEKFNLSAKERFPLKSPLRKRKSQPEIDSGQLSFLLTAQYRACFFF